MLQVTMCEELLTQRMHELLGRTRYFNKLLIPTTKANLERGRNTPNSIAIPNPCFWEIFSNTRCNFRTG